MPVRRRRLILVVLIAADLFGLVIATVWVLRRPAAAASAGSPSASAIPSSSNGAGANPMSAGHPVPTPVPQRASSDADRRLSGGPKYVTCAAVDLQGNAWVGTEDQGLWSYQSGDNWLSYGTAEGLADPDVTALACDALGRLWVGHPDHGLSIFNGQEWRAYDRFSGPGATHIFCIAASRDDVWLGTDAGLARYSIKGDAWTLYDRSTGLPGAAVTSLAVDSAGTLFAGLDSGGLGIATAADGYAKWTTVNGPTDLPIVAAGQGLPSPLVNAICVTRDDTVYVGTCHGLARSVDHGAHWTFVRGRNWAALARGRYDGVPAKFTGTAVGPLVEDYVSALTQDAAGTLWVGHREAGFESFPDPSAKADHVGKGRVTALVGQPDGPFLVGTYGDGVTQCGTTYTTGALVTPAPGTATATFPTPAPAATAAVLDALRAQVEALPPGHDGIDFLGDDWGTQGDWCGRYGHKTAMLLGYHGIKLTDGYDVGLGVGPYRSASPRYYWDHPPNKDHRGQLNPWNGVRAACEFNDESYATNTHPRTSQGPDIYLSITVPAGVHRLSLYWFNHDAHSGKTAFCRDYPIDVRCPTLAAAAADNADDQGSPDAYDGGRRLDRDHTVAAELAPSLARTRVSRSWRPQHKQFLIRGAGTYYVRVDRNDSACTKVNGVFIDRLDGPTEYDPKYPHPANPTKTDYAAEATPRGAAARLWAALDGAIGRQGYAAIAGRARNAAYFAAAAGGVDPDTLARWRYQMPLWLGDDHPQFDKYAAAIPPDKADQ